MLDNSMAQILNELYRLTENIQQASKRIQELENELYDRDGQIKTLQDNTNELLITIAEKDATIWELQSIPLAVLDGPTESAR